MSEAPQKRVALYPEALNHVPQGWRLVPVGQVLEGSQYGLNVAADVAGDVPIVGMKDIIDGHVETKALAMVRVNGNERASHMLSRGNILINRTNSYDLVGKVGIYDSDIPAVFASYLVRLHVKRDLIDPWYLNYWLNHSIAQQTIKRIATRAVGQANINPTEFKKYCVVPLPPLGEQRCIAEILRTWDEAVKKLEALVALVERQHIALSHSLAFGARRLSQFRKSKEVKAHHWFGLPAEWRCEPIGKLAIEVSERNMDGDALEVLSCSKYEGFVRSLEYFKKQVFSSDLTGYKKIYRGDFGFPSNHVEEGSIGLQNFVDLGIVSPIYTVFRFAPEKVRPEFAISVLKTRLYQHIFQVSTSASVNRRGSLRWKDFAKIPFPVPQLTEQEAISQVVSAHSRELAALKAQRDTYSCQKQGLMGRLLTGEWRVGHSSEERGRMSRRTAGRSS